ncbi:hypothetical protein KPH14_009797 [Odynerus spinipes]|uniref:Uncharacterized protein n=1 Tax=Odynerus spinipes TaxID=1348599 RepID=A0AAD9RW39_9HYME|nr:hypothetical protein KPH14_009797 [Odynerus spinipes]
MSKFADLLIKVKQRMDKLRAEIREASDELNVEHDSEQFALNAYRQAEAKLKALIDVAIFNLEKQLNALEASCNDSWLRMFLYVSNYVSKDPKIDVCHEEIPENIITMNNVIFPHYSEDDFELSDKYFFDEYSAADASEKTDHSKSCRRPKEVLEQEKLCFNEEH